jgi:hypothetical protein
MALRRSKLSIWLCGRGLQVVVVGFQRRNVAPSEGCKLPPVNRISTTIDDLETVFRAAKRQYIITLRKSTPKNRNADYNIKQTEIKLQSIC